MENNTAILTVVKAVAKDMARRGLLGVAGDPLPNLMSAEAVEWINANQKAFRVMVGTERIIVRCSR